jgi:glycosyltransferase involved in cell wall biosynthesis
MALVSVIVPTLDRVEFIGGAVETALAQTHTNLEVIVVDGGSTDGTVECLREYDAEDRVTVLEAPGSAIPQARNRGLDRATGEYVCVLDDDDRWHPEKVARQLDAFDRLDDSYGIVYTGGVGKRDGRVVERYRPSPERQGDIYPGILAGFDLNPSSGHMIKRACFERVGRYDPAFPHGEDWELCIRLAREYAFGAITDPLVERRLHGANRSRQFRDTTDMTLVRAKHRIALTRHPVVERRFRTRWYRRRSQVALEDGRRAEAMIYALLATGRAPSPNAARLCLAAGLGRCGIELARRLRSRLDGLDRTRTDTGSPINDGLPVPNGFERDR